MKIYNAIGQISAEKLEHEYYIYVLENDRKDIKIGRSHNAKFRIKSLSGSNGGGSYITKCAISEPTWLYNIEKIAHNHFEQYRIAGTEWFNGVTFEEVVDYIDSLFNSKEYNKCNLNRKAYTLRIPLSEVFKY